MGDTVTWLIGTLGFGPSGAYRVRSIDDGDNRFDSYEYDYQSAPAGASPGIR